jgi:hypothetical protein
LAVIKTSEKDWILSSTLRHHIYFPIKGSDFVKELLGEKALLSDGKK